ncbi:MAG: tetratricopeptide repeat protein [Alphaproteobacteria bacterium]
MARENEAFAREVDEELRVERLAAWWRRWRWAIIGVALAAVVATAATVGWDAWRERARTADARAFDQALQEHDEAGPTADALAEMATDAATGYAGIARLTAAQLYMSADQPDRARDMLAAVAADDSVPARYRDLARLLDVAASFDETDPDAVIAELEPLATAEAPWRHSARELIAAAQLEAGDRAAARATLDELVADDATPQAMRGRARELLAALGGPPADAGEGEGSGES